MLGSVKSSILTIWCTKKSISTKPDICQFLGSRVESWNWPPYMQLGSIRFLKGYTIHKSSFFVQILCIYLYTYVRTLVSYTYVYLYNLIQQYSKWAVSTSSPPTARSTCKDALCRQNRKFERKKMYRVDWEIKARPYSKLNRRFMSTGSTEMQLGFFS